MKAATGWIAALLMLAAAGGYWAGARSGAGHEAAVSTAGTAPAAKKERKLLYYRNPMGLPDTSPVPKKDPMGMDYIAVYEGEEAADTATTSHAIAISSEKVQKLGVRTEAARLRTLDRVVRAAGRVEIDERRVHAIAPKFEGYVERLHVNAMGQPVGKGQPLFEVYSPELVSAQREYGLAAQGVASLKDASPEAQAGMKRLADAALTRLRNWDIPEDEIAALARSGETRRTLTFRSPASGVVIEKKALQGMRFMPGEMLFQVADLSAVWVVADVPEQEIGLVRPGAKARVHIDAYPEREFGGRVAYVYPTMNAETRTVPVRIELANPGGMLKPAMYAQLELPAAGRGRVLTVPTAAVIDSGTRRIVLVQLKEGRYEPREVKLGERGDDYVEVIEGVKEGEPVVVAANFLIDAESNLKAALGGLGQAHNGPTDAAGPGAIEHRAEGTITAIDAAAGTVTIKHGPVASLKWPGMTMDFVLANPALLETRKPGAAVAFSFVERKPGEWMIVRLENAAAAHAGHGGH